MFLPLLPMLMANAPAPEVRAQSYNDFEARIVKEEVSADDPSLYDYTFFFKNTGVGYISNFYIEEETDSSSFGDFFGGYGFDSIFPDAVIVPNGELESVRTSHVKIKDTSTFFSECHAYFDFADDVIVEGDLSVKKSDSGKNGYQVNVTLSGGNEGKYDFGLILKLIYDNNEHYVAVDKFRNFTFDTADDFEINKLTKVEAVKVTRSTTYGYGSNNNIGSAFMTILFMPFVVIFCTLFLILGVTVFCVVFFSILARRKKEKKAALANQENDSSRSDNL